MSTTPTKVYSVEQAGEILSPLFTAAWLRGHIDEIPHTRAGDGRGRSGRIGFTEAHLAEIVAMHEVRPVGPVPPKSTVVTRRRSA
jgi:hypothetical protein